MDGYTVIGAGICPLVSKDFIVDSIKGKLRLFKFHVIDNPFYIDYMLASCVRSMDISNIYGLGLSLCVPGISGPTGGIIGNPNCSISSAQGISEDMGNGLSVAAYPGGPGIIIEGSSEKAETILCSVMQGDGGLNCLNKLLNICIRNSIKIAIMVTDGSGAVEPGCAGSLEKGCAKYLTIGRV